MIAKNLADSSFKNPHECHDFIVANYMYLFFLLNPLNIILTKNISLREKILGIPRIHRSFVFGLRGLSLLTNHTKNGNEQEK